MIMTVGRIVSKISRGQWSEDAGDNDIEACFNSLNIQFRTVQCIFLTKLLA